MLVNLVPSNIKCRIHFTLPAFHKHRETTWNCHVDEADPATCNYNLITGRDLMHEVGIDICFSTSEVTQFLD